MNRLWGRGLSGKVVIFNEQVPVGRIDKGNIQALGGCLVAFDLLQSLRGGLFSALAST